MKLALISDVHLEYGPLWRPDPLPADVDLVVLAGDIGPSDTGALWALGAFPDHRLLYVPGNHEYWGQEMWDVNHRLKRLVSDRFIFGQAAFFRQCGYEFMADPFWTDFKLNGIGEAWFDRKYANKNMEDYAGGIKGPYPGEKFTAEKSVEWNEGMQRFMWKWFEGSALPPERRIIVTHHAPHPNSIHPRYRHGKGMSALNPAFVSDRSDMMGQVGLWIHGHTHDDFDYEVNGTRVVCHPRGGPRDSMRRNYAPKIIELP